MIQDIFPHRFENRFVETGGITPDDYIFHFTENTLLLKRIEGGFEIPRLKDLVQVDTSSQGIFLFGLNGTNCFLVWECPSQDAGRFGYEDISFFRTISQKEVAWTSIVALQLRDWYAHNKFCGKCGTPTTLKKEERAIVCPGCHTAVYPKISPAIIVAILCNDKILLARGVNFRSSFYSLVAGYADVGESLEDAVAREVKEEVGLDVQNIRYYKSQPWPVSGSMMIGYLADADDAQPIRVDAHEISEAAWFSRDNLPNHPPTLSIAGEIIEKFKLGVL